MLIPGLHPLIVHFPLALCITGTLSLLAARLLPNDRHAAAAATAGTWNLVAGAIVALLAIGSGIAAIIGLHAGAAAHMAISIHVKWAMLSSMMMLLLAVWRGAGHAQDSRPSWLLLGLLILACAAMAMTGYRGAVNVYHYGIGVYRGAAGGVG